MASVASSMLPTLSSRMADITDLIPVSRAEFAAEITPCLALTSGVGMKGEDQRTWLNAAYKALDGIPITLLKRGAAHALKVADHPSKIVPAIIAEVADDWKWRREYRPPTPRNIDAALLQAPGDERPTEDEADAICKRYGVGRYAKTPSPEKRDPGMPKPIVGGSDRPGKVPTREDYIRMGVDPAVLDRMDAERTERQAKAA